jgi:hypothetical protein
MGASSAGFTQEYINSSEHHLKSEFASVSETWRWSLTP